MTPEQVLLLCVVALGLVGSLQVWLDRRARRAPKLERFWLHLEKNTAGPIVCDQTGRRLGGIRLMRYQASVNSVDTLVLEVLAHDGQSYFTQGRRIGGPKP